MKLNVEEIWKPISGHDGYYVSNLGNMKRDAIKVNCRNGHKRTLKATKIKGSVSIRHGYIQVILEGKKVSLHRLVAISFCEKKEGCDVVNHLDGDRKNNISENLEWTTVSGNCLHAFRELGRESPNKGRHGSNNKQSKPVVAKCLKTGKEEFFESGMEAKKKGFRPFSVSLCCRGLQKSHKGFSWEFSKVES